MADDEQQKIEPANTLDDDPKEPSEADGLPMDDVKEIFTKNDSKHVFLCNYEGGCGQRAQYTNGRTYSSPMKAKEAIAQHIQAEHYD